MTKKIKNPFTLFWKQDSKNQKKIIIIFIWVTCLLFMVSLITTFVSEITYKRELTHTAQKNKETLMNSLAGVKNNISIIKTQNELRVNTELPPKELESTLPKFFQDTLGISKIINLSAITATPVKIEQDVCYNKIEYQLVLTSPVIAIDAFAGIVNTYLSLFIDNLTSSTYQGSGRWKFYVAKYKEEK